MSHVLAESERRDLLNKLHGLEIGVACWSSHELIYVARKALRVLTAYEALIGYEAPK